MPREKEYNSAADRQRAYRERKTQRENSPPLPALLFDQLQNAALDALSAIEQLQRDNDSEPELIEATDYARARVEMLTM
jgi:hypothetical protein